MARTVRDARLETRAARQRLKRRHEPYWRSMDGGRHIGYRRGLKRASWVARYHTPKAGYLKKVLGVADDTDDADGEKILTYGQAQTEARKWFTEQERRSGETTDRTYTVKSAIRDYLAWYKEHRKSYRDVELRANAFILPKLGDTEVGKLKAREIRKWHEALVGTAPRKRTKLGQQQQYRDMADDPEAKRKRRASANKVLTILKAALNHAWHDGRVESDDAWRRVKPFQGVDDPTIRYLSLKECIRLLNACDSDFRQLVRAALLTGCRYGELTSLQVRNYSADAATIHIRESKSGNPRHVPLNDEGVVLFTRLAAGRAGTTRMFLHSDGEPWGPAHQRRRLEDAAKVAKVEGVTFHILRHSYASALAMQGVSMAVIANALGHADTRTTEKHYAHLKPSHVADTVRANLPALGLNGDDTTVTPMTPKREKA